MKTTRAMGFAFVLAGICIAVSGCRKSMEGSYIDSSGLILIEFKSSGKVLLKTAGDTHEADYTVEGNKVTVKSAGRTFVLTRNADGSLTGDPPLGIMKKRF